MNTGIIASRYADALLKYVDKTGEGEIVYKQAGILDETFRSRPDIMRYLAIPILITDSGKISLMEKIVGYGQMAPSLKKFLLLIISHDRIEYIRYILYYFRKRYCKMLGISHAKLVVSVPSPELEHRLKTMFENFTGNKLDLTTNVDPAIIGGFVFEVDDKKIDASVSRQLEELRHQFIEKNARLV